MSKFCDMEQICSMGHKTNHYLQHEQYTLRQHVSFAVSDLNEALDLP